MVPTAAPAAAAPAAAAPAANRPGAAPRSGLAFTGNDASVEALAGVACLGTGLIVLRLARRRRNATNS